MTNEEAYNIISEFCFTGYEDNKNHPLNYLERYMN